MVLEKGAYRVSFGIKSFNDPIRKTIGLQENAGQAVDTLKSFRNAGFEDIGIGLMDNMPVQTLADVEKAFSLRRI